MANATAAVKNGLAAWGAASEFIARFKLATLASETRFYQNAMVGFQTNGYGAKFDDTQSMILAGFVAGDQGNPLVAAGTAGDAALEIRIQRPRLVQVDVTSIAVADIGKPLYATFDQTGTLDYSATTYANLIGMVVGVASTDVALVEPAYLFGTGYAANVALGGAKRLAATGAQSFTRHDMGKTLFCANTAALALTLPASADVPTGQEVTIVKDHATDANAITLTGAGSDSIDGAATLATLDAAWDVATLVRAGTNRWIVKSRDIA